MSQNDRLDSAGDQEEVTHGLEHRSTENHEAIAQALDLRCHGHSYAEIGVEMGIDPSHARELVAEGLAENVREPAEVQLKLELGCLDKVLSAIYDKAIDGDDQAIDMVLRIMERRMGLLGIWAPQKGARKASGYDPIQAARTAEEMRAEEERYRQRLAEVFNRLQAGHAGDVKGEAAGESTETEKQPRTDTD